MQQALALSRLFLLLALIMPTNSFSDGTELTLSYGQVDITGDDFISKYLKAIVVEAFKRIDVKATIVFLPAERSLQEANHGRVDGEFLRISGLSKVYNNLIEVPEPLFSIKYLAFVNDDNISVKRQEIRSWIDLNNYSVGAVIGWKEAELNTRLIQHRSLVATKESLFQMLNKGRIDVAIFTEYLGNATLKKLKITGITAIKPALSKKNLHIYLHKKHKAIIPKLSASIIKMKTDGVFERFFKKMNKAQMK